MRVISKDSTFRRLPIDIPIRQVLYFDALRLSAEMADIGFTDLHNLLLSMTESQDNRPSEKAVRTLFYAYAVIDALYRFRQVLQMTPGIKHSEAYELFIRQTNNVEDLRHIIQHLNQEVDRIYQEGWAALGTLTWLGPPVEDGGLPTSYILQPGTSYPRQRTFGPRIDMLSTLQKGEIADISLTTAGVQVNLSYVMEKLRSIIRSLEQPLDDFAKKKERFNSDGFYRFTMSPDTDHEESLNENAT